MELNAKTKIGLSFKEVAWAISFIFALGWAYNDIQKDMEAIKQNILQIEIRQNKDDARYEKLFDVVNRIDKSVGEIKTELRIKDNQE